MNEEYRESINEIIEYLNLKAGRNFKPDCKRNGKWGVGLLRRGFDVEDIKTVIDCKCNEWINTKYDKYLRPETLFGIKFESYLQQATSENKNKNDNRDIEIYEIDGYKDLLVKLRKMKYEDYLKTEHWLHFRKQALIFFRNECQMCGETDNLRIHHKSYANRGRETFNDVVCLCSDCHAKFHDIIK